MDRYTINPENAMIMFKATDENMRGHNGFQFELGKTYKHKYCVECCVSGFHCCRLLGNIRHASAYAEDGHNRFFIVKAWGRYDTPYDLSNKKYAFECIEFLKELKYKTLEEVKQSVNDIIEMTHDNTIGCPTNLDSFDKLQGRFPSVLKKRVRVLRNKTIVLENNLNRETIPVVFAMENKKTVGYRRISCENDFPNFLNANCSKNTSFDIYSCEHEPMMGLSHDEAKKNTQNNCS